MKSEIKPSSYPRDVLLKALWNDGNLEQLDLAIISRGSPGDTALIGGMEIEHLGKSFFKLFNGTRIPYHRILEIRLGEECIWSRITLKR